MKELIQSALINAQNQICVDFSKPRRVTTQDVAREIGKSSSTVERCLSSQQSVSSEISKETLEAARDAAARLGYVKVDKFASIRKEFIKEYDHKGYPILNEEAICLLRNRGNSIRQIRKISGVSKKQINRILIKAKLPTQNMRVILQDGLSKKQRHELKSIKTSVEHFSLLKDFRVRKSESRQIALRLLRAFKQGQAIEKTARQLKISYTKAWSLMRLTKSYQTLKNRKAKGISRGGVSHVLTHSATYKNEKSMNNVVYLKLLEKYSDCEIIREANICQTYYGDIVRHIRADFVVKHQDGKSTAIEVKATTTTKSCKVLFGQCLAYKTHGFEVECVIPKDVLFPEFAQEILDKNNFKVWTV